MAEQHLLALKIELDESRYLSAQFEEFMSNYLTTKGIISVLSRYSSDASGLGFFDKIIVCNHP